MEKAKFKFGVSFTGDTTQVDKTVAQLQARLEQLKKQFERSAIDSREFQKLASEMRGLCELLGVKSIEELGRNINTETLLTTRFDGDEAKVQRLLQLCLNGVSNPIEGVSGAELLEVEQDFFMRYALTSGLVQRSLQKLNAQAESLLKASEVLMEQMKKLEKSKPRKDNPKSSLPKSSGLKSRRAG
jgi:uncharacterized protein YukE